jgi:flagellar biosynthesis GTPase FlhF
MVNEVESILKEIRERVRGQEDHAVAQLTLVQPRPTVEPLQGAHHDSLKLLSAHLTTTGRAWDRVPPLYTNRRGATARLELWIKARLKSMSRWFTWEQVNFNAAVHQALTETFQTLSAYQQELAEIRTALRHESESSRERFDHSVRQISALKSSLEVLTRQIKQRDAELDKHTASTERAIETVIAHHEALANQSAAFGARASELSAKMDQQSENLHADLAALAAELRESDTKLLEEQRVCFKQLSLEAGETVVSVDQGRRAIQSRLDKLEQAISNEPG